MNRPCRWLGKDLVFLSGQGVPGKSSRRQNSAHFPVHAIIPTGADVKFSGGPKTRTRRKEGLWPEGESVSRQ